MSRMLRTYLACLALLAAGCSSTHTADSPYCAERGGTYRITFTTRSGNCGTIPEQIVAIGPGLTQLDPNCTGSVVTSADICDVTFDQTCPGAMGITVESRGVTHWARDATAAHATVQFILTDPSGPNSCQGTYDVVDVRL